SSATASRLPDAARRRNLAAGQARDLPVPAQGIYVHAGVYDTPSQVVHAVLRRPMLPSDNCTPSTLGVNQAFAAQYPACTHPCRRFAAALTGSNARLGAGVVRVTFTVKDFLLTHHPQLALALCMALARCGRRPRSGGGSWR